MNYLGTMSLRHVTIGLGGGGVKANLDNVTKYEGFFLLKASLNHIQPDPANINKANWLYLEYSLQVSLIQFFK